MVEYDFSQEPLFEEHYLLRTLGALAHSPDVALTELVANAWDAGASSVEITIPASSGDALIVEDDGTGLTREEFHSRWMRLGYDRLKHQSRKVTFPEGRDGSRLAYGRKGIGRHGLLCFDDEYSVKTTSGGSESLFVITTKDEKQPFFLKAESIIPGVEGHGTRLDVVVSRNLPNPDEILEVISARFLHDPQFTIFINGKSVPLTKHQGLIDTTTLVVEPDIELTVLFIDTSKAGRTTLYQGVAFWQSGRLVGEPSWILGKNAVIDGRTHFAKRYTFVVKTDDLSGCVNDDWTGFSSRDQMNAVYDVLSKHILSCNAMVAKERIKDTKQSIRTEFQDKYTKLSRLGQYEVDEVIEHVAMTHPTANQEVLSIAVEAVINLEESRSGRELLEKLSHLSETDIEGLNVLLEQWTIKDALSVLDEIDNRLQTIEAISGLAGDPKIDELTYLHPLVTDARWLFGYEYDSSEYTSNRQLRTVAKKLFHASAEKFGFESEIKRPDIVVLPHASISVTGTDVPDHESGLFRTGTILIIELKRGGSVLNRADKDQALGYVEDFVNSRELLGEPAVRAFLVGDTLADELVGRYSVGENGKLFVTTFGQLVDTARHRLFNLRNKLKDRYQELTGQDLIQRAEQLKMELGD